MVRVSKMLLMMLLRERLQVLGKLLLLLVGVPFVAGILLRMRMILEIVIEVLCCLLLLLTAKNHLRRRLAKAVTSTVLMGAATSTALRGAVTFNTALMGANLHRDGHERRGNLHCIEG